MLFFLYWSVVDPLELSGALAQNDGLVFLVGVGIGRLVRGLGALDDLALGVEARAVLVRNLLVAVFFLLRHALPRLRKELHHLLRRPRRVQSLQDLPLLPD